MVPAHKTLSEIAVELTGVSASWTKGKDKDGLTLKNVSMRIRKGKLCAIIGPVGSGKVCHSVDLKEDTMGWTTPRRNAFLAMTFT